MKDLLDAECGGANPLMRLGGQITRDAAIKSERNDYFGQNVKSPDVSSSVNCCNSSIYLLIIF